MRLLWRIFPVGVLVGLSSSAWATPPTVSVCDRSPPIRKFLESSFPRKACAGITAEDLSKIDQMLVSRGLEESTLVWTPRTGDFADLTGLTSLRLSTLRFTSIPQGIFRGLTRLRTLNLYEFEADEFDGGVFCDLPALQYLSFAPIYQKLGKLVPQSPFSCLKNLVRLSFSYGKAPAVTLERVFAGLSKLQSLTLHGNHWDTIPKSLLEGGLDSLVKVWMVDNDFETLPSTLFGPVPNLRCLSLTKSRLKRIPYALFAPLSELEVLWIDKNPFDWLDRATFSGNRHIRELQIGCNHLEPRTLAWVRSLDAKIDESCNFQGMSCPY